MHEVFSKILQEIDLDATLVRFREWSALHTDLLRAIIIASFMMNLLVIMVVFWRKAWIKERMSGHDTVEKAFILSFFAVVLWGISSLAAAMSLVGLQFSGASLFSDMLMTALLIFFFVLAFLVCFLTFLILFVRLFISMTPAAPPLSGEVNWGGTPVLVVILAFFVVSTIFAFFSGTASSVSGSLVFISLPIFLVVKTYKRQLAAMGVRKPIMKILALSLFLVPILVLGNGVVYEITERIIGRFPLEEMTRDMISGNPLIMSIQLGILGPVGEELFFRGFAHTALRRKYGFRKGIILSSLFFGVYHIIPWQIPYAFVAGLILAYVYERTQSIYSPILFHILNNAVAVLEVSM